MSSESGDSILGSPRGPTEPSQTVDNSLTSRPFALVPDASFLLFGEYERVGFDLVIRNPDGEVFIVHDYFGMVPPPNLLLANGAGLSPEMVRELLHIPFEGTHFAGPAESGVAMVEIGKVTVLVGRVTATGADGVTRELKRGDALYKGDEIRTSERAFIKATMSDGTRFHLGKSARATLSDYEFDESAGAGKFEATVVVGGFHYSSGKIGQMYQGTTGSHSTIRTPSAIIGIRGSELDGTVDGSGETIVVHTSGFLVITDINGLNPVVLEVPGHTSVIVLNGTPLFTTTPSEQQLQTLQATLPPPDAGNEEAEGTGEDAEGTGTDADASQEDSAGLEQEGEAARETEEIVAESEDEPEEASEESEDDASEGEDLTEGGEEGEFSPDRGQDDGVPAGTQATTQPGTGQGATGGSTGSRGTTGGLGNTGAPDQSRDDDILLVNRPPQPLPDTATVAEAGATPNLYNALIANDSDPDPGNTLAITDINTTGTLGTVEFNASNQTLVYVANAVQHQSLAPGQTAIDVFRYTLRDSLGAGTTTTVTITVTGVNTAPTAINDTYAVAEGGTLTVPGSTGFLANDIDPDSPQLTLISASTLSQDGAVVAIQPDGSFVFVASSPFINTLARGQTFASKISYVVEDNLDATDSAEVTVNIAGVNDAPVAVNDSVAISENGATVVSLLGNDSDVDQGAVLSIASVSLVAGQASLASVTIANASAGTVSVTPGAAFDFLKPGEQGFAQFKYVLTDEHGATSEATVDVTISGANDAPLLSGQLANLVANEDIPFSGSVNFGVFTDPEGEPLTFSITGLPPSFVADGNEIFGSPGESDVGVFLVTVTATDPGGLATPATFSLEVIKANDPPVATNDSFTVAEDTTLLTVLGVNHLLLNDSDPDGDPLTINTSPIVAPEGGALTIFANGTFSYTPDADFTGTDSFIYQINDGKGGADTAAVTLVVTPANDPPGLFVPAGVTGAEDSFVAVSGISVSDIDAGTGTMTVTLSVASGILAASGPAEIAGDLTSTLVLTGTLGGLNSTLAGLFYQGDDDFEGVDVLTIQASDNGSTGAGGPLTDTAAITLTITGVNDAPIVTAPASAASVESAFTLVPGISISDVDAGDGVMLVSVTALNGLLAATGPASISGNLTNALDLEGSLAEINATLANLEYQGGAGFSVDAIDVFASDNGFSGDGGTLSDVQSIAISIAAANDAPEIGLPLPAVGDEDTPISLGALTVTDPDIGTGTMIVTLSVGNGNLTASGPAIILGDSTPVLVIEGQIGDVNATLSTVFYQPLASSTGTDSVTIVANDNGFSGVGGALTDTATLLININPINDAPEILGPPFNAAGNEDDLFGVSGIVIADSDAGTHSVTVTLTVTAGILTASGPVNPIGDFSSNLTLIGTLNDINDTLANLQYQGAPDATGTEQLTIVASDGGFVGAGGPLTDTAVITLTINAVNDAPFLSAPSFVLGDEETPIAVSGVSVFDSDAATGDVEVTLTVTSGVLIVLGLNQVGSGTNQVVITDNQNDVNLTLATLEYVGNLDFSGFDNLHIQASDLGNTGSGGPQTSTMTVTVNVNAGNDGPIGFGEIFSLSEGFARTGIRDVNDLLVNDVDPDGDLLNVNPTPLVGVSNGTLILFGDGTFTYQPNPNFNGTDSFVYQIEDGLGGVATATANFTINAVNEAPTASDDFYAGTEDNAITSVVGVDDLLFNDVDTDGDLMATSLASGPKHGNLLLNSDGTFTYTPEPDFQGTDSFVYKVTDGNGGSALATASLTIGGIPDAPTVLGETYSISEEATLNVFGFSSGLLANDFDVDGDSLSVIATPLVAPAFGDVFLTPDGSFFYMPATNFTGVDSFTYQVTDGSGGTSTGVVTINVGDVNDRPVAKGASNHQQALLFSGPDDQVKMGRGAFDSLAITGDLTVETWVNVTQLGTQELIGFTSETLGEAGNDLYFIEVQALADGNIDIQYRHQSGTSSDNNIVNFDTNLNLGDWHHIAVVRDVGSQSVSLYLDGSLFSTESYVFGGPTGGTDSELAISPGAFLGNGAAAFKGMIDELRIWDTQRTAEEISAFHNQTLIEPQAESQLVGYWHFDRIGPDGIVDDASFFGNHGNVGGPLPFDPFAAVAVFEGSQSIVSSAPITLFEHSVELMIAPETGPAMPVFATQNAGSGFVEATFTSIGTIQLTFNDGSSVITFESSATLNANGFTHFAYSFDSAQNQVEMYFDGVRDESVVTLLDEDPAFGGSPLVFALGQDAAGLTGFSGVLAEFRVWSHILEAAEVIEFQDKHLLGTEPGLQLYYRLDEGAGTTAFDYAQQNNGVASEPLFRMGSPTLIGPSSALDFNGTNQSLDAGNDGGQLALTGDVTVEAWVKLDGFGVTHPIVTFNAGGETEDANALYKLFVDASGGLFVSHESGPGIDNPLFVAAGDHGITDGQWFHVAAIRDTDEGTWTLMVNGLVVGKALYGNEATGGESGALQIGADVETGSFLDGQIFDVRVWNTSRSIDEVRQSMATPQPNDEPDLLFNALLNDDNSGVAVSVLDASDNPIAIAGSPTFVDIAPAIFSHIIFGHEDVRFSGQLLGEDVETVNPTFSLIQDGDHGTVVVAADGSFTYTPADNFSVSDKFTFKVVDDNLGTDTRTIEIRLQSEAPAIVPHDSGALFFSNDQSSDSVFVGHSPSLVLDTFTIAVWVNTESTSPEQTILQMPSSTQVNYSVKIVDGFVVIRVDEGGPGFREVRSELRVNDGEWHHIAATFDPEADALTLYVDAVATDSVAIAGLIPVPGAEALSIGSNAFDGEQLNGSLFDLRIYNQARQSAGIQRDMDGQLDDTDDLVLHFQFDGETYPLVVDKSGNGNHGISGGGGAVSDDTPVASDLVTTRDTPITINGLSIVDSDDSRLVLKMRVNNGTLTLADTSTIDFGAEDDLFGDDGELSFVNESQAALTDMLARGIIYTPHADFTGVDTLMLFVEDRSGGNSYGTPISVIENTLPEAAGIHVPNNAAHFNGSQYLVETVGAFDPGANAMTVEIWADISTRDVTSTLISKGNSTLTESGWSIKLLDNNYLQVSVSNGLDRAGQQFYLGDTSGWHHIALVIDQANGVVLGYLDGSNEGFEPIPGIGNALGFNVSSTSDLVIGAVDPEFGGFTPTQFFTGAIDEVRIWNTARSAAEMDDFFHTELDPGEHFDLVSYYNFNAINPLDGGEPPGLVLDLKGSNDLQKGDVAIGDETEPAIFGYTGSVLEFDGVDDVFNGGRGPGDVFAIAGDLTLQVWVKLNSVASTQTIVSFDAAGDSQMYGLAVLSGGDIAISHDSSTPQQSVFAAGLEADTWYHISAVRDDANELHRVFVNGVEIGSGIAYAGAAEFGSLTSQLLIGSSAAGNDFFDGQMADLRIWQEVLPNGFLTEAFNFRSFVPLDNDNLVANFHLNDTQGVVTETRDVVTGTVATSLSPIAVNITSPLVIAPNGSQIFAEVQEGVPVQGRVIAEDGESGVTVRVAPGGDPFEGTITVDDNGNFAYVADKGASQAAPIGDANLSDQVTFQVIDAAGDISNVTLSINITTNSPIIATIDAIANGDWPTPATWGGIVPGVDDDVEIASSISVDIDTVVPADANSLYLVDTASLSLTSGLLTIGDRMVVGAGASLDIAGGTLSVGNRLTGGGSINWTGGTINAPIFQVQQQLNATNSAPYTLNGDLVLVNGSGVLFNGPLQGDGTAQVIHGDLVLRGGGTYTHGIQNRYFGTVTLSGATTFSFQASIVTAGVLILDDSFAANAALSMLPGNALTIESDGIVHVAGSSGTRSIRGDVDNAGEIIVDHNLTVFTNGSVFDTSSGDIEVAAGRVLTFNAEAGTGTLRWGDRTEFNGGGTVAFSGNHTVELVSDFVLDEEDLITLDLNVATGTIVFEGPGTFLNGQDLVINRSNISFDTLFINGGDLTVQALFGNNAVSNFNQGLLNAHYVTLDDLGSNSATLNVSGGDFDNYGTLLFANTPGDSTGNRIVNAQINNYGVIDVGFTASINNTGTIFDTAHGAIDLREGFTLTVSNGTTVFGKDTALLGTDGTADVLALAGIHTLYLDSDYSHDTKAVLAFTGIVTVTGADWLNASTLTLFGGDDIFNVRFINNGVTLIEARSGLNANPTFTRGFANNSLLQLDDTGSNSAAITVDGGQLVNDGTILFANTPGDSTGPRTINADVLNRGLIDVDTNASITNAGRTFDTSNGAIDLSDGATLTIDGGTTVFGVETRLIGTDGNDDILALAGTHALSLRDFYQHSTSVDLAFTGAVTVTGADWFNSAPLRILGGDDLFDVGFFNVDHTLIEARSGQNANGVFAKGFFNQGQLQLDDVGSNQALITVSGGDLVNAGSIWLSNSQGDSTGNRIIDAQVVNVGVIEVDTNALVLNAGRTFDHRAGVIEVAPGVGLSMTDGTLLVSSNSVFLGAGGTVFLDGTLNLQLDNVYTHSADVDLNLRGVVTVTGNEFSNQSSLLIRDGNDTFDVAFTNDDLLTVQASSGLNASILLTRGIVNNGTIILDDLDSNSAFLSSSGEVRNLGLIHAANTGGGATGSRHIVGDLKNEGALLLDTDLTINGDIFNTIAGSIDLSSQSSLFVNNPLTLFGGQTVIAGSAGTLDRLVINGDELRLSGDYRHSTLAELDLAGNVTITGDTFTNNSVVTLYGSGDTIDVFFDNIGTLRVEARGGLNADAVFSQGIRNSGEITLDDLSSNNAVLTVTGGRLFNDFFGEIKTVNIGGGATGGRTINADIFNKGIINVLVPLNINGDLLTAGETFLAANVSVAGDFANQDQGDVDIFLGNTLSVVGGGIHNFVNDGEIGGQGTLDVSDALSAVNNGTISPGSLNLGGSHVGTLTITGDIQQTANGALHAEINNLSDKDLLAVSGHYGMAGTLKVEFLGGHDINPLDSFVVTTFGSSSGAFSDIIHNLSNGYFLTADYNPTDVTVTLNTDFESVYDNSGGSNLWSDPTSWSGDILPGEFDDVLIDGFDTTYNLAGGSVGSLSLEDSVLVFNGGSLALNGNSRFDSLSTLSLTGGSLSFQGNLWNDSVILYQGGSLGGSGTFHQSSLGQLTASGASAKTYNMQIENDGFIWLQSTTHTFNGAVFTGEIGTFYVENPLEVNTTVNVNGEFINEGVVYINAFGAETTVSLNVTDALVNDGTMVWAHALGLNSAFHTVSAGDFFNRGSLEVEPFVNLNVLNTEYVFDNRGGTINVGSDSNLRITGGDFVLGFGSDMSGSGTMEFVGNAGIRLDTDFTLTSDMPGWVLGSNNVVEGPGVFTVGAGANLQLTNDQIHAPLVLAGSITNVNGLSIIGDYFRIDPTGTLTVDAADFNTGQLRIDDNFTSRGTVILDHSGNTNNRSEILRGGAGLFRNEGTIISQDTGGAITNLAHFIDGDVTNLGQINVVSADLRLGSNDEFDSRRGAIDVAAGRTLEIQGGTAIIGSGTELTGGGNINLLVTTQLQITSNVTLGPANPQLLFGGTVTVNGAGVLTLANGATLNLTNDTVNTPLLVDGTLQSFNSTSNINSRFSIRSDGVLVIDGADFNNGLLNVTQGFENDGLIILDHSGFTVNNSEIDVTNAVLTNRGTIRSQDTNGGMTGSHRLDGSVLNLGVIDVDGNLSIENVGEHFDTSRGTLDIATGRTLFVTGGANAVTTFGSGTVFAGGGTIDFSFGTNTVELDSDVTIDNADIILQLNGTVTFEGEGTLTIAPDSNLTATNDTFLTDLRLFGQFTARNSTNNLNGELDIRAGGTLLVDGIDFNNGLLNITQAFTNFGSIVLDHSGTTVNLSEVRVEHLTNQGLVRSQDTGGGANPHIIDGSITHQGVFDIRHDLRIENEFEVFDMGQGSVFIAADQTFFINRGMILIGDQTTLIGAGTLEIGGSTTILIEDELGLHAGQPNILLTGTVIINGPGGLGIREGAYLELTNDTIATSVYLEGTLKALNNINTISGPGFVIADTGVLLIDGTNFNNGILTVNNGLTNNGTIVLDHQGVTSDIARLNLTNGVLINQGIITSADTNGGNLNPNRIEGQITNTGAMDVGFNLQISNAGSIFDNSQGLIRVAAGATLFVNTGTFIAGEDSVLTGDGTINFTGLGTVELVSSLTIDEDTVNITSGGTTTYNGFGDIQIERGGSFVLTNDRVNTNLYVAGSLTAFDSLSEINGSLSIAESGELKLDAALFQDAELFVSSGFDNFGTITLDHTTGGTNNLVELRIITGELQNYGTIRVQDTGDDNNQEYRIDSDGLNNFGHLLVSHDVLLDRANATYVNDGLVEIIDQARVRIFGSGAQLTNDDFGILVVDGEIAMTGGALELVNNGHILPGGIDATGLMTVSGNFSNSLAGTIEIDIASESDFDQINVNGNLSANGLIHFNFLPGHGLLGEMDDLGVVIPGGDYLEPIISYASSAGSFVFSHNLSAAYTLDLIEDTGSFTFDLRIQSNFDDIFDGGGADTNWSTGNNWVNDVQPSPGTDVLIGSGQTATLDVNATLNSLTLRGGATLELNAVDLTLNDRSRTDQGTTIVHAGGGDIILVDELIVDGILDWQFGDFTGFHVIVNGTLETGSDNTKLLSADLSIVGNAILSDSVVTSVITGGTWNNYGTTSVVDADYLLDVTFDQHEDATLEVSAHLSDASLELTNGFINNGLVLLNNFNLNSTSTFASTLTVAGAFENEGIIRFDADFAENVVHTLDGRVINNGEIIVNRDAVIANRSLFDTSQGHIEIASGRTLTIAGGVETAVNVGEGTTLGGDGSLLVTGISQAFELVSDFKLDFAGTLRIEAMVLGNGEFKIAEDSTLIMDDNNVLGGGIFFNNHGQVTFTGDGTRTINGVFFNNESGLLNVFGGDDDSGRLQFESSVVNLGTIVFDQTAFTAADFNELRIRDSGGVGTLTNAGEFRVQGSIAGERVFNGHLDNAGIVRLDYDLNLDANDVVVHENSGEIIFNNAATLTLGFDNALVNLQSGAITGSGTIDNLISGAFVNEGTIDAGDLVNPGTLNIMGDANLSASSKLQMDIGGTTPGTDHDQLNVGGNLTTRGRLAVNLINGFTPTTGNTFALVTAGLALVGSFDSISGLDITPNLVLDASLTPTGVTLEAVDITDLTYSNNDDVILGTASADVVLGGGGDDVFHDLSSGDIVYGQAGNDTIFADSTAKRVDGGAGIDILVRDESIDYTVGFDGSSIDNIEVLSLRDGAASTITLDATAIAKMVDGVSELVHGLSLVVIGDPEDQILLTGDFFFDGSGTLPIDYANEGFIAVYDGTHDLIVDQHVRLDVTHTDGTMSVFGSSGDDTINGTAGNDHLAGRGGADTVLGNGGDDTIRYDSNDAFVDGGSGIDTLFAGGDIDLTHVDNLKGIEQINLTNGESDTLKLDIRDLLNIATDNALDDLLATGTKTLLITGDTADKVVLNGVDLGVFQGGLGDGVQSNFVPHDPFDNGEMFISFFDLAGKVELLVHTDLVNLG